MSNNKSINATGYKNLMVAIVYQALHDLTNTNKKLREKAKRFLLSEEGEMYCIVIGLNYGLIKAIDFDNPSKTLDFSTKTTSEILINNYDELNENII